MSEGTWHLSKNITLSTVFSIVVLFVTTIYTYGQTQEKLKNLEKKAQESSEHVSKQNLQQMLENRDIKIQALTSQLDKVDAKVDKNQELLIELLQRIPKRND